MSVVDCKKVKVHRDLVAKIGNGMATNGNGLGVEFE
jgi:hypothetical protein